MSLTALNSFGQTSVSYTEDRTARVLFDRVTAINQTAQTAKGLDHTVPVGIEIIDIIKPENINAYMEILIASVPTATVTLDTTPSGVTVESLGGGLHRIIPINSKSIWDQVKSPRVTIPNTQSTNFTYTITIKYDPSLTKSYTVTTTIVNYGILAAQFVQTATADVIPALSWEQVGAFSQTADALKLRRADSSLSSLFYKDFTARADYLAASSMTSAFTQPSTDVVKLKQAEFADLAVFAQVVDVGVIFETSSDFTTSSVSMTTDISIIVGVDASMSSAFTQTSDAEIAPFTLTVAANNIVGYMWGTSAGYVDIRRNGVITDVDVYIPAINQGAGMTLTSSITDTIISIIPKTTTLAKFEHYLAARNVTIWNKELQEFVGSRVDTSASTGLTGVPNYRPPTLTKIDFFRCQNFNDQNVTYWDMQAVQDFSYMFFGCINFDQDIGVWDTSSASNMQSMFSGLKYQSNWSNALDVIPKFNKNLNNWNTSNVTNMKEMFAQCNLYNQPMNSWNTSSVTNMEGMFNIGTGSTFNQDISSWSVNNVTNVKNMFSGANSFNQDISIWNLGNAQDNCIGFEFPTTSTNWTYLEKPSLLEYSVYNSASRSTAEKKFGTHSVAFPGSSVVRYYSPQLEFGSGDFTIEFWFYLGNLTSTYDIFSARVLNTGNTSYNSGFLPTVRATASGQFRLMSGASQSIAITSGTGLVTAGAWHHAAVSRSGTSTRLFFNGSLIGSSNLTLGTCRLIVLGGSVISFDNAPLVGTVGSNSLVGYIDALKISDNAVYTTSFSPPASAPTSDANTRLLLNFDSNFRS